MSNDRQNPLEQYQAATYGPSVPPSAQIGYTSGAFNAAPCGCEANRMERQRIQAEIASEASITPRLAHQLRAPGKMFARSDILAILKGHLALAQQRPPEMNERDAIRALIAVFENLE